MNCSSFAEHTRLIIKLKTPPSYRRNAKASARLSAVPPMAGTTRMFPVCVALFSFPPIVDRKRKGQTF